MIESKPTIVVTGVSGNLGQRLLSQLHQFRVVGLDMRSPHSTSSLERFYELDLGRESSCAELVAILRNHQASAVIHLAFVIDPLQTGVLDEKRMWHINVAGTARVMEAIAEVNRTGGNVSKFIFPSSVSAYGPDTPELVNEDYPLGAHTLPYAVHKKESDEVVQSRVESLGACSTFILRPHIFTGASMQNYLVGALRGTPTGKGRLATLLRQKWTRLPMLLPLGDHYLGKKFQFVHVDDMARLIAYIVRGQISFARLQILNVAGRGDALTIVRCAEIGNTRIMRLPGRTLCKLVLKLLWTLGISGVPPDALPYIIGSYTMNTIRLKSFLGRDYETIIHFTIEDALADSFNLASQTPEKLTASTVVGQPL